MSMLSINLALSLSLKLGRYCTKKSFNITPSDLFASTKATWSAKDFFLLKNTSINQLEQKRMLIFSTIL
jgi:hypothetical protein